jgi:tetratricopeptide (TPR) repeat protein
MSQIRKTTPATFNFLSIGHRGVGKTVFLAGSYIELQAVVRGSRKSRLWLECQDQVVRDNVENLLNFIRRTGQYPPPTIKITNFNFSIKHQGLWGTQTLYHFRWWDVPGEICHVDNPDFQSLLLTSHGCCVFINADALVHDPRYLKELELQIRQVEDIASLSHRHSLKYAFALICTQCDRLQSGPLSLLQIEKHLRPLTERLEAVNANYQRFYSAIPIVPQANPAGGITLHSQGAAAPLVWLMSELSQQHETLFQGNLASELKQVLALSPEQAAAMASHGTPEQRSPQARRGWLPVLLGIGCLGTAALVWLVWQQSQPNFAALGEQAEIYTRQKQYQQAVPFREKQVQLDPQNIELRFELAELYDRTDQKQKAETVYDQILTQEKDNVRAMLLKAKLRSEQGDRQTAQSFFQQAEQLIPTAEGKSAVRAIAQDALKSSNP